MKDKLGRPRKKEEDKRTEGVYTRYTKSEYAKFLRHVKKGDLGTFQHDATMEELDFIEQEKV